MNQVNTTVLSSSPTALAAWWTFTAGGVIAGAAREWLDPATQEERSEQMVLQQGEPTEEFEWFKVDHALGNSRNQGPELTLPA
ncbi:hypothetical protein D3C81_1810570 [compost metagenome]